MLLASLLSGCSAPHRHEVSRIDPSVETAVKRLHIGMTEGEALAIMKPVSLNWGRVTYGGTGAGELYFQVSTTQQIRLGVGPNMENKSFGTAAETALFPSVRSGPEFVVGSIGHLERKTAWVVDANHNFVK